MTRLDWLWLALLLQSLAIVFLAIAQHYTTKCVRVLLVCNRMLLQMVARR